MPDEKKTPDVGVLMQLGTVVAIGGMLYATSGEHSSDIDKIEYRMHRSLDKVNEKLADVRAELAELKGRTMCEIRNKGG